MIKLCYFLSNEIVCEEWKRVKERKISLGEERYHQVGKSKERKKIS